MYWFDTGGNGTYVVLDFNTIKGFKRSSSHLFGLPSQISSGAQKGMAERIDEGFVFRRQCTFGNVYQYIPFEYAWAPKFPLTAMYIDCFGYRAIQRFQGFDSSSGQIRSF